MNSKQRRTVNTMDGYEKFRLENIEYINKYVENAKKSLSILQDYIDYSTDEERLIVLDRMKKIKEFIDGSEDLLRRLEKNNIEVGVIGREKAGKSSMINAWLGYTLLPAESKRCTYTTTEIRSCEDEDEQKLVIEYLTKDGFYKHKAEIENELKTLNNDKQNNFQYSLLENELKEINEVENTVRTYLDKPTYTKQFNESRMSDLVREARDAIATPSHARAVKSVILYTTLLFKKGNVTFYDVPGYDSPMTLHKEQTKKKSSTVDAIIFAKNFDSPSIVDVEQEMIRFMSDDKYVAVKDKIIVALTKCDSMQTRKEFDDTLGHSYKEWEKFGVPKDRIVPVSSVINVSTDNDKKEESIRRLKNLKCVDSDGGIQRLKDTVERYVINTNYFNLNKRCKDAAQSVKRILENTIELVNKKFPLEETEEQIRNRLDADKTKILNAWWAKEIKLIFQEFEAFMQDEIYGKKDVDTPSDDNAYLVDFHKKYLDLIMQMKQENIPIMSKESQFQVYRAQGYNQGLLAAIEGHTAIRKELTEQFYVFFQGLSVKLADIISEAISNILEWIYKRMWCIREIKDTLFTSEYKQYLNTSIEALILRLGRPAIDLFLRYPRSDNRIQTIKRYEIEMKTLDLFYRDEEVRGPQGLPNYLANGEWNIDLNAYTNFNDANYLDKLQPGKKAETFEEVHDEIKNDTEAFIDYMKNSVYFGGGLEAFFNQEIDKISQRFKYEENNNRTWQSCVFNAIENDNALISIPDFIREAEKRIRVSAELKALDEYCKELKSSQ